MFEIWLGDDQEAMVAVHVSASAALDDLERIADRTMRQLVANGEGHRDFVLYLTVREGATGEVAATFCALA